MTLDPETAKALHAATDDLNIAIDECEVALINLHVGVRATVALGEDMCLTFMKLENRWRLAVEYGDDSLPEPLRNTPRHVRLKAATKLGELVAAFELMQSNELARVLDAAREIRRVTEALQ